MPSCRPPRRVASATTLVCAALLAVGAATGQEPLRWKLEPGAQLRYRVLVESKLDLAGDAGAIKNRVRQATDMVWTVEKVNEDRSATIRVAFDRIQMVLDAPGGQSFALDTSSSEDPSGIAALLQPMFDRLTEDGFRARISPLGELSGVEASEELLQAFRNFPGVAGAAPIENLQRQAEPPALPLPEGPVGVGTTWTHAAPANATELGPISIETTYTCKGVDEAGERPLTRISQVVAVKPEGRPPEEVESSDVEVKETAGEAVFDHVAGRLDSSESKLVMEVAITTVAGELKGTIEQSVSVDFGKQAEPLVEPEAEPAEEPVSR